MLKSNWWCSRNTNYSFNNYWVFKEWGLASTGAYPFNKHREDLALGEGSTVFVLESGEVAKKSKAKICGQILSAGPTADAYHGNVPYPQVRSVIIAIKQCLKNSNLKPEDIDVIHAHGTITQLNGKN